MNEMRQKNLLSAKRERAEDDGDPKADFGGVEAAGAARDDDRPASRSSFFANHVGRFFLIIRHPRASIEAPFVRRFLAASAATSATGILRT